MENIIYLAEIVGTRGILMEWIIMGIVVRTAQFGKLI
jgi:hypothetical protein